MLKIITLAALLVASPIAYAKKAPHPTPQAAEKVCVSMDGAIAAVPENIKVLNKLEGDEFKRFAAKANVPQGTDAAVVFKRDEDTAVVIFFSKGCAVAGGAIALSVLNKLLDDGSV